MASPIFLLLRVLVIPVAAFYAAILWRVGFPTLFILVGLRLAAAIAIVLLLVALDAIIPFIWHWGTPRMRSL